MQDIAQEVRMYPDVNFRYYISPSKDLPIAGELFPISMTRKQLKKTYKMGYWDARNSVKAGAGAKYAELVKFK
jgi:hypothetical protein